MNNWLYLNAWELVEESLTNCLIKARAYHPTVPYTIWADWVIATKQWQSASFRVTGLFILFTGTVFPWKTMQHPVVFPCCCKDLISSRRKLRDKAQQQAMHHGTGDRELGGCFIWPFVRAAAYSSEQNESGADKSVLSSTRCIASSRAIQTHVHACHYFKMYIRKCGAHHSNLRLRAVNSLYDACIMLKMPSPTYTPRTLSRKGQWCGIKQCADAQPIRIITQVFFFFFPPLCCSRCELLDEYGYPFMN